MTVFFPKPLHLIHLMSAVRNKFFCKFCFKVAILWSKLIYLFQYCTFFNIEHRTKRFSRKLVIIREKMWKKQLCTCNCTLDETSQVVSANIIRVYYQVSMNSFGLWSIFHRIQLCSDFVEICSILHANNHEKLCFTNCLSVKQSDLLPSFLCYQMFVQM